MLLIFLSTTGSSARIAASPDIAGPGVTVPSMRPPVAAPVRLSAALPVVVVDPPEPILALPVEPEEFAVPKLFVPAAVGSFAEFPAPLGSLPELLSPPALAGPLGTPLKPAVPAPAEPAFGDPTALPVPAEGPLAAPPAAPPPADHRRPILHPRHHRSELPRPSGQARAPQSTVSPGFST
jgi:hypothetical protein